MRPRRHSRAHVRKVPNNNIGALLSHYSVPASALCGGERQHAPERARQLLPSRQNPYQNSASPSINIPRACMHARREGPSTQRRPEGAHVRAAPCERRASHRQHRLCLARPLDTRLRAVAAASTACNRSSPRLRRCLAPLSRLRGAVVSAVCVFVCACTACACACVYARLSTCACVPSSTTTLGPPRHQR